jgi:enoyl-CoA hydratase/carnithine racemase
MMTAHPEPTDDIVQLGAVDIVDLGNDENTFSGDLARSLTAVIREAGISDRPLVLAASGKFWCSGLDLGWLTANPTDADRLIADVHELIGELVLLARPTVAAINGHAFGAGAMLALGCDIRVMNADNGYFCLPEVDLGLAPTQPMIELVTARLGRATAAEVLLSGRRYTGREAATIGVVDFAVAADQLMATVEDASQLLVGKPSQAMSVIKRRIWGDVADQLRTARGSLPPVGRRG